MVERSVFVVIAAMVLAMLMASEAEAIASWTSPDRYRVLLTANARGVTRSKSPITVRLDLPAQLTSMGGSGTVDECTIEVVAYDTAGNPKVFDSTRPGYEKYLLPHNVDKYYGVNYIDLNFVMPDHTCRYYAVYFDTEESGLGNPQRYHGLVGNGDYFREGYKRREINACHLDCWADLNGDGRLDLFKGGVGAYVDYYENVGDNHMVYRGRLTSGGQPFKLPASPTGRAWMSVAFYDWDGDGDLDFLPSFSDGPDADTIVLYRNITTPGGQLTFTRVGPLKTKSGKLVAGGEQGGGIFPSIAFAGDWDGDGHEGTDIIVGSGGKCWLYRSLGRNSAGDPILDDAVAVQAGGKDIELTTPRFEVADIDGDGKPDLFAGCHGGPVYMYRNIGTRTEPKLAEGVIVAYPDPYLIADAHSGIKVADWDGDGLLDIVVGRYWERTLKSEEHMPRYYGGLYKNVGTKTEPKFEKRDEFNGSPYTERFQKCDAVHQNCVRMVDWDNDGKPDLIAGDTDGYVWYFRNLTGRFFPVFDTGRKLMAAGDLVSVRDSAGHARPDICDWNNDGKKDLIVADGKGWITLFLNVGTDDAPVLAKGVRLTAGGQPIDSPGSRSSVIVCDWNNDGRKDVVQADDTGYYLYRNIGTDAEPVLAARAMIKPGGQPVTYIRPNLGSFVDWDGDGKKDLIGCNFESNIRLYRNIGTGGTGAPPTFADPEGQVILQDDCIQVVSGADASDWHGDGDRDILTGQGHGGSGLRFFARDYIYDRLNNTHPMAVATISECAQTISQVRELADGAQVVVASGVVTGIYNGAFYIGSKDRVTGIRVQQASHGRAIGDVVDVRGKLASNAAGERYIAATSVVSNNP